MAVTSTPLSQIQRIADTEAERNTGWPNGSRVFCLDTLKMYILTAGVFQLIGPSAGGAAAISQTEVDFGATPVADATFVVADANVSAGSKLLAQIAYVAPTGKDVDEIEMDNFVVLCQPGTGQLTLFMTTVDGSYLADKFKINYQIGA